MDALAHAFQLELTNCIQMLPPAASRFTTLPPAPLCFGCHLSRMQRIQSVNRSLPLTMLARRRARESDRGAQAEQLFTLVEDGVGQLARLLVNDQGVSGLQSATSLLRCDYSF